MTKKHQDKWNISFETLWLPLLLIAIFYSVAWWRYSATGRVFYVYNFGYIGTALALGVFLSSAMPQRHILWGRRIAQFLIGSYLLVYVGFVRRENMQIEGFFFYLLAACSPEPRCTILSPKSSGRPSSIAVGADGLAGRRWCSICCRGNNHRGVTGNGE